MAFTEDPSEFFDVTNGFAVNATYDTSNTIPVIFDQAYVEELTGVAGTGPAALCQASSVAADPTDKTLVVNSISYTIKNFKAVEPDGVLMLLILKAP